MFNQRVYNRKSGQTLIIAIMVMFILAVISAVFIALVARNLFRSERFSHVDSVAQIAEAGVRYADKMLVSGEDGADWRPVPDNYGYTSANWEPGIEPTEPSNYATLKQHPDYRWIKPYWPTELGWAGPSGGYTTYDTGGGRFLLRVTYAPDTNDPLSKYIKIESIGRWGVVNKDDPTTLGHNGDVGMRREITAYKPIGVTDYLRFITNKNHRSINFPLGCPGYDTDMGRYALNNSGGSRIGFRGAPIRVNGNLLWYGDAVNICLRGVEPLDSTTRAASTNLDDLIPIDRVEVAGDILHANDDMIVTLYRMNVNGEFLSPSLRLAYSDEENTSGNDIFDTENGFYRDDYGDDATRNVKRLEPPLLDNPDTTDTTTRYRLLTLNSGERIRVNGAYVNTGRYGWGRGIYIDNTNDTQDESNTLFGGYSLRADWLKPNNSSSPYWKGPFYVPPGVSILLNPNDTDGDGLADVTITRNDGSVWYDPEGNARPGWGSTITMPYPDPANGRELTWMRKNQTTGDPQTRTIDGNGVIYAEGNIRIRGMLPPNMQLTVVSNANIYIEGSILKYRDPSAGPAPEGNYRTVGDSTGTCGIALLAKENVCVNTTQFFSPTSGVGDNIDNDNSVIVSNDPDSRLRMLFEFGPHESELSDNLAGTYMLLLRHSGQYGTSYINAWLNSRSNLTDWGILYLNTNWTLGSHTHTPPSSNGYPTLPRHVWAVGDPGFNTSGWGIDSSYIGEVFPLIQGGDPVLNSNLNRHPGMLNDILIGLDQSSFTRNNYLFGGMAIQPMDVRIEALIYAQEGSFFVLPGNWFNPNPSDTQANYEDTRSRPGGRDEFPFFGDPLDIRIIIDGTITENMPAMISDVNEWMSKWGKIPEHYGSTDTATTHPGEGLTFLYDDHAGWPYKEVGTTTTLNVGVNSGTPIRQDKYGRTLPLAPRLPVCTSLFYFGDVM
ncbi:MAG: hypothetical protein ABFD49_07945 [Armatimonadota bacterium]|nr:hypothetical protein [bacterium]